MLAYIILLASIFYVIGILPGIFPVLMNQLNFLGNIKFGGLIFGVGLGWVTWGMVEGEFK